MQDEYIVTRAEVARVIGIAPPDLDSISLELGIATAGNPKQLFSFLELIRLRESPRVQALLKARAL